jgi:hypothetical protein
MADAGVEGFKTPEEAALATWAGTPTSQVQIVKVEVVGDRALVVIADGPGHYDNNFCERDERGLWRETGSMGSSGPASLDSYT